MNLGLGPVFVYEWLTASRRWQMYALRSLFVALLLAALGTVWYSQVAGTDFSKPEQLARVGEAFFYAIVGTELALVLLVAPAATAGAVCLDKARGSLLQLMTTDLRDYEIVLGKLAARLVPVLGLVFCSLPVMLVCTFLGGIEPEALIGAFLVILGVAVLSCSLALALSVWGTKTHEVLMVTYFFWIVELLLYPIWLTLDDYLKEVIPDWLAPLIPEALRLANPFWLAFSSYANPGSTEFSHYLGFFAGAILLSIVLVLLTILRVRPVTIRHSSRPARDRRGKSAFGDSGLRRWFGPSLDGNPVLWLEWRRKRSSRWMRGVWILYALFSTIFSLFAVRFIFIDRVSGTLDIPLLVNGFQVSIGLLLLSVGAVTALAEERARGRLDILLITPMTTGKILWGKWCGLYRGVFFLTILPVLVMFALALAPVLRVKGRDADHFLLYLGIHVGLILAYGAGITSLGLALATWISRPVWAITANVSIYLFITIGWLFLVFTLFKPDRDFIEGLAMASPLFGSALMTDLPDSSSWTKGSDCIWATIWIVLYFSAAGLLFLAVCKTFDRCMGRASERAGPPTAPERSDSGKNNF